MFTEESPIVKSYVLLIRNGRKTIEEVPDFKNLKEVVKNVLDTDTNVRNGEGDV